MNAANPTATPRRELLRNANFRWLIGGGLLSMLGGTVLLIDGVAGLIFLVFGHVHATWQGALLLLPLGALAGFVQVAVYSWMQKRFAPQMLGRSMALFMFIVMGLAPLASAAAGAALRVLDVTQLFSAAALCLLVVVTVGVLLTPIRSIRYADA